MKFLKNERDRRLLEKWVAQIKREQNIEIDGEGSKTRFRHMYSTENNAEVGKFSPSLNVTELALLKHRQTVEDWAFETPEQKAEFKRYLKDLSQMENSRLMEEILKVAPIKDRPIEGTNSLAFEHTLKDQKHLEVKMNELKVKFHEVAFQWDKESRENCEQLLNLRLTEEDLKFKRDLKSNGPLTQKKDQLIERLQEALVKPNMASDDVCNLLVNDLYE